MTLTELRYIVAVARERHFGRAAEACHVSQPTLSVAIKKLEEELQTQIFERTSSDVALTTLGAVIIQQAQRVLEEATHSSILQNMGRIPYLDRCDWVQFIPSPLIYYLVSFVWRATPCQRPHYF